MERNLAIERFLLKESSRMPGVREKHVAGDAVDEFWGVYHPHYVEQYINKQWDECVAQARDNAWT